jgi:hypothetical protein
MPPLIVAVLIGAGAYAGFKAVGRMLSRASSEDSGTPSPPNGDGSSGRVVEKNLGNLEFDPATGAYRPVPPLR